MRFSPRLDCTSCGVAAALLIALAVGCPDPEPPEEPVLDSSRLTDEEGLVTALVCPGSLGCRSAGGALHAGVAVRSITPLVEPWEDTDGNGRRDEGEPFDDESGDGAWNAFWLGGFSMGRAATGVHDDLWARAVAFRQGEVSVGLVALDLVGLFQPDAIRVRRAALAAGLDFDHVVVTTTHNHEAPDTMGIFGPDIGTSGYDPAYVDLVIDGAVEALAEAVQRQRPARLEVAQRPTPELIHDSRLPHVIDEVITAVKLTGEDGAVLGSLVVWGNHPEALGGSNTLVTSDYPHYLRERFEEAMGGAPCVFFSGSLGGLMNPLHVVGCPDDEGDATCLTGEFEKARYIGEAAADIALQGLSAPDVLLDATPVLGLRRRPVLLEGGNRKLAIAWKGGLLSRPAFTPEGEAIDERVFDDLLLDEVVSDLRIGSEVNVLQIGPLEVVAVPGELYPELWLLRDDGGSYIERPADADFPGAEKETPLQALVPEGRVPVVLNNANDALGYIIPLAQYDAVPPWAYDPDGQYGEENSVGPMTAPALARAFERLYELTPFTKEP